MCYFSFFAVRSGGIFILSHLAVMNEANYCRTLLLVQLLPYPLVRLKRVLLVASNLQHKSSDRIRADLEGYAIAFNNVNYCQDENISSKCL